MSFIEIYLRCKSKDCNGAHVDKIRSEEEAKYQPPKCPKCGAVLHIFEVIDQC